MGGRGVVEAATGTGKTALALGAAGLLRERHGSALRVVVIVPTQALAGQWVRAFRDSLKVPKELIGEQHSAAQLKFSSETVVLITVINTARTKLPDLVDGWVRSGRKVLVVVDECHRAGSEWNSKVLETAAQHTLGLSATPERSDGGHRDLVYPGLGEPIYRYSLLKALDDGVLAPLRSVNLYVDFTTDEELHWTQVGRELSVALKMLEAQHPGITFDQTRMWVRIADLAAQEDPSAMRVVALVSERRTLISESDGRKRCMAAIERWLVDRGHRAMVFHETIAAAEAVAAELRTLGAKVALDHSKRPRALRDKDLAAFRDDRARILVAVRSLDEGIDVPDASVAVLAAGSRSKRQRIQRLGRILRLSDGKQAVALTILVRSTPEESEVGGRDEDLLGQSRIVHHRWPGRGIADAVADKSSYRPVRKALDRMDQLVAEALEIGRTDPTPDGALTKPHPPAGTGGYVATATHFSRNGWHAVAEVRLASGMPPAEFDRLRGPIRTAFFASLDAQRRADPSIIHGAEIEAIRRRWDQTRRGRG